MIGNPAYSALLTPGMHRRAYNAIVQGDKRPSTYYSSPRVRLKCSSEELFLRSLGFKWNELARKYMIGDKRYLATIEIIENVIRTYETFHANPFDVAYDTGTQTIEERRILIRWTTTRKKKLRGSGKPDKHSGYAHTLEEALIALDDKIPTLRFRKVLRDE